MKKRIACHSPKNLAANLRSAPRLPPRFVARGQLRSVASGDRGGVRHRVDVDAASITIESDLPIDQGKNGVIATKPDVFAGQKFRPALADDNVAGDDGLTAKFFYAEPFA